MPTYIQDEFSNLKVSKHKRLMLRKERDGKCYDCQLKRNETSHYCDFHQEKRRLRNENRNRRKVQNPRPYKKKIQTTKIQPFNVKHVKLLRRIGQA